MGLRRRVGCDRPLQQRAQGAGDLAAGQGLQGDAPEIGEAFHLRDESGHPVDGVVGEGEDQQDGQVAQPAREEGEAAERLGVGQVGVVDADHRPALGGQLRQGVVEGGPAGVVRAVVRALGRHGPGRRAGTGRQDAVEGAARHGGGGEELPDHPERQVPFGAGAGRHDDMSAPGPHVLAESRDECGLSAGRGAPYENDPAALVPDRAVQVCQGVELACSQRGKHEDFP